LVNGNIKGIKKSLLDQAEHIYDIRLPRSEFVSGELTARMAEITAQTGREVSVFLSREGRVLDVSIGDQQTVLMPYIRKRRGYSGISGVRCIHTHPKGSAMLSDVDISTLLSSKLDAMAAVSVRDGKAQKMCVGFIGNRLDEPAVYGPFSMETIPNRALMAEILNATQRVLDQIALYETHALSERALLIGIHFDDESMLELKRLADTAGVTVVSTDIQARERDGAYYIGSGKAKEIALNIAAMDIDVVIADDELTPLETKNLEQLLGVKVLDRTMLILDIFAQHAKSREGKLQVELAQLKYSLPRLEGTGTVLSRLGGGIGTRGPGEKKLEVDKRRIRRRIFEMEREIAALEDQRNLRRSERIKNRIKSVALVGYTNAGKSSLLNALSGAGVIAEDKLFATLDSVSRRVRLPSGTVALFTDTVGFINKLPHELVSAFKSTLEETVQADVLLNVIDASSREYERQSKVVYSVLESLGAAEKTVIDVYNKSDLLMDDLSNCGGSIFVSAKEKTGLDELLAVVDTALKPKMFPMDIELDYSRGDLLSLINEHGRNVRIEYLPKTINIRALLPADVAQHVMNEKE